MSYTQELQKMFYEARIGSRYGCFEVIDVRWNPDKKKQLWTLKCVYCGTVRQTYSGGGYVSGYTKGACGCQNVRIEKPIKIEPNPKPRMSDNRLYRRWTEMKRRCYNPSCKDYKNYGGRGIKMCDEWKDDFWSFVE